MTNRHTTGSRRLPARLASALVAGTLLVGIAACDDAGDEIEDQFDEQEDELDEREEELEDELEEEILD